MVNQSEKTDDLKVNRRSDYLVVLIATYNRLDLLKKTIDSIEEQTRCSHEVVVIDGGSTDGTIEYLENSPDVTPVFQGKLIGPGRAYNQVWQQVKSKYSCWLSDDTKIVNGSLDVAVGILERHADIGMVGLKMKEAVILNINKPYGGAISWLGILNCNHGVLPTSLARSLGFFNQDYPFYGFDPDITASVLCAGYRVVLTKKVGVFHSRVNMDKEKKKIQKPLVKQIYMDKFGFLEVPPDAPPTKKEIIKGRVGQFLGRILFWRVKPGARRLCLYQHDWRNIMRGKFIHLTDPLENLFKPFHLVQRIPETFLTSARNPYLDLFKKNTR